MELQRRIFQVPNTPHHDHWVLEVDDEYVSLKRYLFGLKREEIRRGHWFMAKKYPDYRSLPFEEWALLDSNDFALHAVPNPTDSPETHRINAKLKDRMSAQPSNFFYEIHDRINDAEEITDSATFNLNLGVLTKDQFGDWQTERFSPAMKNIVRISFERAEIDLDAAAAMYVLFEKTFPKHLPQVWSLLRGHFEWVKADSDYCGPEIQTDEEVEGMISFSDLFISDGCYGVWGHCDWDDEHGFQLSIDAEFKIVLE